MTVERNVIEYHKNIGKQLELMQNQVRNLIGDSHWLSDGQHKEVILQKVIREHIGSSYHVGSGFVYCSTTNSNQIDILITEAKTPTLFQEGDFKIITPESTAGIIEVKTQQVGCDLKETLKKISQNIQLIRNEGGTRCCSGLFAYDPTDRLEYRFSELFQDEILFQYHINWICLGPDYFIRYWRQGDRIWNNGETIEIPIDQYRLYKLPELAYSYFINNAIMDTNRHSDFTYENAWFPLAEGKETHFVAGVSRNGRPTALAGQETI